MHGGRGIFGLRRRGVRNPLGAFSVVLGVLGGEKAVFQPVRPGLWPTGHAIYLGSRPSFHFDRLAALNSFGQNPASRVSSDTEKPATGL